MMMEKKGRVYMTEAGMVAAMTQTHEQDVETGGERLREERRGAVGHRARTSAQFLDAMTADFDQESEELRVLSPNAVQLLGLIIKEPLNAQLVSEVQMQHVVDALLTLRGPMMTRAKAPLDYRSALQRLFSSPETSYGQVAREVLGNSTNSTYISLRKYVMRCAAIADEQGIPTETLSDLIEFGTDLDTSDIQFAQSERAPRIHDDVPTGFRHAAHIAMGPVFDPEPPRPSVNNPYALPIDPTPTPRDRDDKNPLAWQTDGLCAQTDPEAFFPEKGGSTRDAKRICASCEVRAECLEYALQNDERFGIWGGLSERERRKLKRRAS
jgi:WhiB family redox-sensing transcriptional regulator